VCAQIRRALPRLATTFKRFGALAGHRKPPAPLAPITGTSDPLAVDAMPNLARLR
jgi:hypothetical protein